MSQVTSFEGRDPKTGRGVRVTVAGDLIRDIEPFEAAGHLPWIAAGLVDLQVNGYGGLDLNAGVLDPGTVSALCRKLAALGVTRFLPTVITAPEEAICQRLAAIAAAHASDPLAARMIAGIHVEGPFISPEDGPRGAHRRDCVRDADATEIARWQEAAGGLIRIVTLAPEVPGAIATIRAGVGMGLCMSLGHSAASAEDIHAAAEAGASLSTHLGNGIASHLARHPNAIWAQLADDRLTACFICDSHHLPADTAKAMLRAKGVERSVLVSDSVAVAGLPPGRYQAEIGGDVEVSETGRVSMAGTVFLAGSGDCLATCVARASVMSGLALHDCLSMASDRAAEAVGLSGGLKTGERADLVLFDWSEGDDSLCIRRTVLAGETIHLDAETEVGA